MRRIIFSVLALVTIFSACKNSSAPPPSMAGMPMKVVVEAVRTGDAVYHEEYPATVVALNEVQLRPQVSGFITGIHFRDGDRVKKGQLLYSIDAQLYNANYEQAVANLSVQEANLAKAQKDADRYHELARNDAVAKQLVDNAEAALEVAKKQAEAAKANISGVQTSVRYTKVIAPFDGVIGISQVKPGTAVTAGQTLLNTVSSDNQLAVDFNIDQKEIYALSKLISTNEKDSIFRLAFGSDQYPYPGKLAFLDRAVDPQTGTLKARLIFPNKNGLLRAGMNGTVRVRNQPGTRSILIPYKAVTEQLGEYFVYVPGDSSKVTQTKVELGRQIGTDVIVRSGLKQGDSIVTQGVQNLREGSVIQSVAAAQTPEQKKN
ncbi:MAG: efflux RND transporter periplasmic adaptor subunit [Chitinophagaceae bacterium]|nr:efflux RND transporter periplasmic adaptor subunit [Chitinophagaceae bacterium]